MKSRITIEVDFDNGNLPVIQILQQDSEDVRDNLIASFLQSLQHTSRWCRIEYRGNRSKFSPPLDMDNAVHSWHITPIKKEEIQNEMDLMWAVIHANDTVSQPANHSFGEDVGESQYKDMVYQRSIQNPYPSDSGTHTAYEKGFTDCFNTFSKAAKKSELSPNLEKK